MPASPDNIVPQEIPDINYRTPCDLSVTQANPKRVLVIGSCLLRDWRRVIETSTPACLCDFYLFNNASDLPANPPKPTARYDFQLVQIPLRTVLPDRTYFRLGYGNIKEYDALFSDCKQRIAQTLRAAMRWNISDDLLAFVFNFIVPQMNPLGRLLPRYDLRNMVYFVERLNQALADELTNYRNAFLFDFDQILSTFGKKYFADDAVWQLNHASALEDSNLDLDKRRQEPVDSIARYFPLKVEQYRRIAWNELLAMHRTLLQVDSVKLVAVDIDDTLWRGVALDSDDLTQDSVEGWPLGLVEALGYLRRRGVLLAVLSRNDENRIEQVWDQLIYGRRLSLNDFAIKKINWRSKVQNIQAILSETNILPRNIVVVDDSPVERAAIIHAYPEVRVFGSNPYVWRRILLWSSETQVPTITLESTGRTEAIKRKLQRDRAGQELSRAAFLETLGVAVRLFSVCDIRDKSFPRALELLNKTNQFNTTGKRWTTQECAAAFKSGMALWLFSVSEKFSIHGIVGVVVVNGSVIQQFVMSCRVIGMDVEHAVIAQLLRAMRRGGRKAVTAAFVETEANQACRELYQANGFVKVGDEYVYSRPSLPKGPSYVSITLQEAEPILQSRVRRRRRRGSDRDEMTK